MQNGYYICYNKKAWVNGELIKKWIDLPFPPILRATGKALVCGIHVKYILQKMSRSIYIAGEFRTL